MQKGLWKGENVFTLLLFLENAFFKQEKVQPVSKIMYAPIFNWLHAKKEASRLKVVNCR